MKKLAMALLLGAGLSVPAFAGGSNYVKPHVRKDGTFVQGHYRTNPDSSRLNNYGTQGNYNPYTGQQGTVNPYAQPQPAYGVPVRPLPNPQRYAPPNPYAPRY